MMVIGGEQAQNDRACGDLRWRAEDPNLSYLNQAVSDTFLFLRDSPVSHYER
jgi:hypothetical protein